jgi:hypothetical protein
MNRTRFEGSVGRAPARRARHLTALLVVLAAASALVASGSSKISVQPTLYVHYTMDCGFTIRDDNNALVSSIAPGAYQIVVTTPVAFAGVDLSSTSDFTACKGFARFQLTGPGVNVATTLQDGDADYGTFKATFQAGSTYTARDAVRPDTATAFSTLDSGSPSEPAGPASAAPTKGGSDLVRATLVGKLTAIGDVQLTKGGAAVTRLMIGRYKFSIADGSSESGFKVQHTGGTPITLTGVTFVGKRTVIVTLTAGQWKAFSGKGNTQSFTVV